MGGAGGEEPADGRGGHFWVAWGRGEELALRKARETNRGELGVVWRCVYTPAHSARARVRVSSAPDTLRVQHKNE